jgi:hypothetical protein
MILIYDIIIAWHQPIVKQFFLPGLKFNRFGYIPKNGSGICAGCSERRAD